MTAVFVFDRDGDLNLFADLGDAEGWLEAVDVELGEYSHVFLHDGTVVQVGTSGETVALEPGADHDHARLQSLIFDYQCRVPGAPRTAVPLDFANQWLQQEWEARWPKRPAWLAHWLHGSAPKQVDGDDL